MNYNEHPGARWSNLKEIDTSPLHYQDRLVNPREGDALRLGTAIHACVLEPEWFDRDHALIPSAHLTPSGSISTGEKTRTWLSHLGDEAIVVTPAERETCLTIRDRAAAHPVARRWLAESTEREVELFWTETEYAVPLDLKGKCDAVAPSLGLLWDLKSMSTKGKPFSLRTIVSTIASFAYHGQLALYSRGLAATGRMNVERIGWMFVESQRPYDLVCCVADDDMMRAGWDLADRVLRRYAEALAADSWPGVSDIEEKISLPAWAKRATTDDMRAALEEVW